MVAKTTAKKKRWFIERCEKGCQICCAKRPSRKNYGLQFSHIVSRKDGGRDTQVNCLVLCPNCSDSFDLILKPAVYEALKKLTKGKAPESWRDGEGRLS